MSYNFYTYKEIRQQPRVWKEAYDIVLSQKSKIQAYVHKYLDLGYKVVLTGAGTSAYIGDALAPALHGTIFRDAAAIATTDIITSPELWFDCGSKVLLVSFARSGNSPESIGAVRAVEKTAGATAHLFITCNASGQLAGMKGDNIFTLLLPPETNDLSLAMTSSYSTMFIACALVAHIDNIESQKVFIDAISDSVARAMDRYEKDIKAIATLDFKRAIFLGSGTLKGVAEESRLKLQELTDGRIMCGFDSFLGFRHGPKAIVNSESLLIYLLSPIEKVQRYERDLIKQIELRNGIKGSIIVCRQAGDASFASPTLTVETGLPEGVPGCYGGAAYVFVAQMLGFFKSLDCGLNPDAPSVSGNISRVVEGVTLYD